MAAGAALVGLRPVVEYQFADFISCAFDPIVNVLAKHYYRTGDPMPVTMRAPFGGRLRAGPCHSQSVESYFAHVPGIKIVMPGTPEDAAGLLISSIRDNNPTLYLENKYLYRRLKAAGPITMEPIPLGVAKVVREGRDITLITYSAGVHQGLEIAEELDKEGISVEVIDVRTLVPLDVETIVNSVKKTSRAVVLHEAAHADGLRRGDRRDDPGGGLLVPGPADQADRREEHPDPDQSAAGGRCDPAAGGDRGHHPEGGQSLMRCATVIRAQELRGPGS